MEHNSGHTLHSVNKVTSTIWAHFFSRVSRLFSHTFQYIRDRLEFLGFSFSFLGRWKKILTKIANFFFLFRLFPREILFDHLPFQCTWRSFIFYSSRVGFRMINIFLCHYESHIHHSAVCEIEYGAASTRYSHSADTQLLDWDLRTLQRGDHFRACNRPDLVIRMVVQPGSLASYPRTVWIHIDTQPWSRPYILPRLFQIFL